MVIKITNLIERTYFSPYFDIVETLGFGFNNDNFFDDVAAPDLVNDIKSFGYLAKTGVFAVKMGSVFPVMADKELRTTGISSCMGH